MHTGKYIAWIDDELHLFDLEMKAEESLQIMKLDLEKIE